MNPFDSLKAMIRTVWPAVVAWIAAQIVTVLADKAGVSVDGTAVAAVVFAALLAAIYGAGRALEKSSVPAVAWLGRLLVSLGMDLGQPTYVKPDEARPMSGTPPGR